MNCKLVYKNLIGYIEHTLSDELKKDVDHHLNECDACRNLYYQVSDTYQTMDKVKEPGISPFFFTRLQAKLHAKPRSKPVQSSSGIIRLKPVVVTVLMAASIMLGIFIGERLISTDFTGKPDRKDILDAYATDYYLTGTIEESTDEMMSNE